MDARFSGAVQTRLEAHPTSRTVDNAFFTGVRRPECCADHPPFRAPWLLVGWTCLKLYLFGSDCMMHCQWFALNGSPTGCTAFTACNVKEGHEALVDSRRDGTNCPIMKQCDNCHALRVPTVSWRAAYSYIFP